MQFTVSSFSLQRQFLKIIASDKFVSSYSDKRFHCLGSQYPGIFIYDSYYLSFKFSGRIFVSFFSSFIANCSLFFCLFIARFTLLGYFYEAFSIKLCIFLKSYYNQLHIVFNTNASFSWFFSHRIYRYVLGSVECYTLSIILWYFNPLI